MSSIYSVPDTCIFYWLPEQCLNCSPDSVCTVPLSVFRDLSISQFLRISTFFNP